ncbi:hypothetical protein Are01nite_48460 [Actinoplanes regularis]|nr:hypothetical protein Are01nite_48460 [Actinoplanes regularis]
MELAEEYRVDFWLAPGDGGPGMMLADLLGHWFGPALRWVELRGIVRAALPDRVAAARRLLLLAPFLGDAAAGDEAVDWLARALGLVSGRDQRSAEVRAAERGLGERRVLLQAQSGPGVPVASCGRGSGAGCGFSLPCCGDPRSFESESWPRLGTSLGPITRSPGPWSRAVFGPTAVDRQRA